VSCLLSRGLDAEMHDGQTLGDVLDQIDMRDANQHAGNIKSWNKSDVGLR